MTSSKEFTCQAGDKGSFLGSGKSPGEGDGNPLQYAYLGNPMERSLADYSRWGCRSWTRLSNSTTNYIYTHTHIHT